MLFLNRDGFKREVSLSIARKVSAYALQSMHVSGYLSSCALNFAQEHIAHIGTNTNYEVHKSTLKCTCTLDNVRAGVLILV